MADQDQVPQGAIPPKVTPFAKPEGAAAVTPAVVPGAPRPITVRLRPTAPVASPDAPVAPAVGIPAPPATNPRSTARVPVPESVAASPMDAARPATVRLRPVMPPGGSAPSQATVRTASLTAPGSTQPIRSAVFTAPGSTQPIAPVPAAPATPAASSAVSPMQPQHPPTPGSNPLPDGPKPPSPSQVQAAKSKTSRISLDSAIGVAPMTPMGSEKVEAKTIRLKRPTDLAAPTASKGGAASPSPIRQTSRIPDAALPTAAEAAAETSSVTQKKTLKIKRPGMREVGAAAEGVTVSGEAFPEGVQMTPIGALDMPVKSESSVFTVIAATAASLAAVVLLMLTFCLGAHAVGPNAGKNALPSIKLGSFEFFWPGGISN